MNEFWSTLKALEGKTVKEVRPHLVPSEETVDGTAENGLEVECTDGYTVAVTLDYEDVELVLGDTTRED